MNLHFLIKGTSAIKDFAGGKVLSVTSQPDHWLIIGPDNTVIGALHKADLLFWFVTKD